MNTYHVAYGRDGMTLVLLEQSRFRDTVVEILDRLCAALKHPWPLERLFQAAYRWLVKSEREVARIPLSPEDARKVSGWLPSWLDGSGDG